MSITNKSAHRGDGGRVGIERGQRFISYPQYTPFSARLQYAKRRGLMRLAVLLSGVAEALARTATRWECGA